MELDTNAFITPNWKEVIADNTLINGSQGKKPLTMSNITTTFNDIENWTGKNTATIDNYIKQLKEL